MQAHYKTLVILNSIGSLIFIGLAFGLPEIVLRFLVVGELPDGTTLLSADSMLVLSIVGIVITICLLAPISQIRKLVTLPRLRLPKRRYSPLQ